YPSYSNKYHLMMQQGQGQQQHSPAHSQTPTSQQQQTQLPRVDDYYYRGPGSMGEAQHQHNTGGFVPPQLDIKPGFVNAIPAAYWTPATPSDAAFSNTLPTANVFHGGDPAAAHMRPFDSMVPQHPGGGHPMGAHINGRCNSTIITSSKFMTAWTIRQPSSNSIISTTAMRSSISISSRNNISRTPRQRWADTLVEAKHTTTRSTALTGSMVLQLPVPTRKALD
ncbi:hypothetical protein H4S07_001667, partial [Coemansia furcata]